MIVYTIITLLLLLNKIQPVIGRIVELQSSSGLDVDCGQDLTSNDTCHIICSVEESLPPNIYCREAGKCMIDCTGYYCLSETNIYASNSSHLALISSAEYCLDLANIYLPNNGNATIIGTESSNAGTVLHQARVYAGTATNYISITCDNPSGKAHLWSCQQLFVDASTANVLEITVNDADLSDASIRCPVDSALSPSCVIDAFAAESTENLIIYADNGMPQDVEFYSLSTAATNVYKNTRIICTNSSSTINANGNTFVGTPCFITLAPTISDLLPSNLPTKQPTDPPSKLNTEIPTISSIISAKPSHSPSGFPTNQPSEYPTQDPHELTSAPTRSSIITNNPTQQHQESTAGPSYVLTADPSRDSTINDVETTQYVQMTTNSSHDHSTNNVQTATDDIVYIYIAILLCLCICVIVSKCKRKERYKIEQMQNSKHSEIERWLKDIVKLPQYYALFTDKEYDSLQSIMDHIEDEQTLTNIGITLKEHRVRIMKEINHLKGNNCNKGKIKLQLQDDLTINGFIRDHEVNDMTLGEEQIAVIQQKKEVKQWLTNVVRLPQYYDAFVVDGFEDMELIKTITSKTVLEKMEIHSIDHQTRLMSIIEKLRETETNSTETCTDGEDLQAQNEGELDLKRSAADAKPFGKIKIVNENSDIDDDDLMNMDTIQ